MSTTFGLHRAVLFNRDGVATLFEDRRRTWAEVAERVARLAGALRELGVGRGDRVAILMLNQDRYLELYLGVAWAGAVVAPLNIRWTAQENQDCAAPIPDVEARRPNLPVFFTPEGRQDAQRA